MFPDFLFNGEFLEKRLHFYSIPFLRLDSPFGWEQIYSLVAKGFQIFFITSLARTNVASRRHTLSSVSQRSFQLLVSIFIVPLHIVKADLTDATGITHLSRMVRTLLEDPFNEKWIVDFVPEELSLTLRHPTYANGNLEVPLTLKNADQVNTLEACLLQTGTCRFSGNASPSTYLFYGYYSNIS